MTFELSSRGRTFGRGGLVEIAFDQKGLARWLEDLASKQVPFVMSLAVNETAKDAQKTLREQLPKHFTVRSPRTRKGIRFERSHKKRWPKIEASVGSLDEYMGRQAKGGTKRAKSDRMAVPSRKIRGPGGKRKTTPAKWPNALIAKDKRKKVPKLSIRPGSAGSLLLYKRAGGKRNQRFELLYVLVKKAKVPRRWPLEKTVEDVVAKRWSGNVLAAARRAMRTARR